MQTTLSLSIGGLPPMSARGCIQEIRPIAQGEFQRTVNGELVFVGSSIQKFHSTIQCEDETVLATEGLHIGAAVTVGCIQNLCQKIPPCAEKHAVELDRPCVMGSISVVTDGNEDFPIESYTSQTVTLAPHTETLFVFYAPILHMRVVGFKLVTNEWHSQSKWQLELEEI